MPGLGISAFDPELTFGQLEIPQCKECIVCSLKGEIDGQTRRQYRCRLCRYGPAAASGRCVPRIDREEIVYRKCYGLADLETQRPITTDSSFYLASLSKAFTAMAIMLLAEQGKLRFEDRLLAYFPQFPTWGAEITVRHLLHHTSGLPTYFPLFTSDRSGMVLEFTRDITASPTKPSSNGS